MSAFDFRLPSLVVLPLVAAALLIAPNAFAFAPEQIEIAPPRVLSLKPVEVVESDTEMRKLLKQRYNATVAELKVVYELFVNGRALLNNLTRSVEAFALAGAELAETPVARISELELARDVAKYVESITVAKTVEGQEPKHASHHARACRLGIEIKLLRAREAAKAAREPAK